MSNSLWGGRFEGKPDPRFERYNRSFPFDRALFRADCLGTRAQVKGLEGTGVLTKDEAGRLRAALGELEAEAAKDPAFLDDDRAEDVHSFLEAKLVERLGDLGKKVHTGRSRNDQVATAFRIWMREACDRLLADARDLQRALVGLAEEAPDAVLPGYTHLQRAQPILFPHFCLAYVEMIERDRERLRAARARANVCPLGSGALAGSGFAVDREAMAKEAGFDGITRNSLDAVSDRDFVLDALHAASVGMAHLSRLAEDCIVYASQEFGFFELSDAVSTGSSLMPQKKNPDAFELIRGKAGRVFGHQMGMLATVKGLPLAYNKDLQEDKEAAFDALATYGETLAVTAIAIRNTRPCVERMREAASRGYLDATELADVLVEKGMPFREAHEVVGKLVREGIRQGKELRDLPLEALQAGSTLLGDADRARLTPEAAVRSRKALGGTAPDLVKAELSRWKKTLA